MTTSPPLAASPITSPHLATPRSATPRSATPFVVDSIVIGAGPAGLATAHELMRVGQRVLVLERGTGVGMSWRTHRPGLRLHTVRRLSSLPGMIIPRRLGRYVTSADLVHYLEHYVVASKIDVRFGVAVSRVRRVRSGLVGAGRVDAFGRTPSWRIDTSDGTTYTATTVVMATGYNQHPYIPRLPGLAEYQPPHLHVAEYRGGDQFAGLDVLVVGAGNAAAEAATELVASGARRVRMAVRTTPHIVRRRVGGVSMQSVAIAMSHVPLRFADRLASVLARLTVPDLSAHGLARPRADLYTRVQRDDSVPVHDTGIVALLQSGAVTPVAAVTGFEPGAVQLADGSVVSPEVVLFASGYRRGLDALLNGLDLLDHIGNPRARSGTEAAPGFYFVGFTVSATGALREIARDARRVAQHARRRVRL